MCIYIYIYTYHYICAWISIYSLYQKEICQHQPFTCPKHCARSNGFPLRWFPSPAIDPTGHQNGSMATGNPHSCHSWMIYEGKSWKIHL